ncbi:MAG: amidohydrolase [Candidatus Izemoplasmatales bacterium]|nr:amidohydrolase [Candidatus Izemoplasmatales bacterium]MDD4987294.1 amidohydrolase [Candidatus Izemoplasmatales bacterium]MDY0372528.1 amidohydrolase [Candidatus Izemoplasmatales bacterium]NLF48503.1 amidohydrolase [Acholeplasmataceae bacterium]
MVSRSDLESLKNDLIQIRRWLHRHPEVGFEVANTHDFIQAKCAKLSLVIHPHVGRNSLVAVLENGAGPIVGLRADMDALPLIENNPTIDYQSENHGAMHACGHDAHTAMLITTAQFLATNKSLWNGTVKFIFQEAEEGPHPGGADGIIKSGLLADVDQFYALHVSPEFPSGVVAIKSGVAFAAVNTFKITINGRGGHAAYPHLCIDPMIMASEAILGFQTIISRKLPVWESAVVSVAKFIAGSTHNIIPDSAYLEGTVRTFSTEARNLVEREMTLILDGVTSGHGGHYHLDFIDEYRSVHNTKDLVCQLERVVTTTMGKNHFLELSRPSMGGEDFFRYIDLKQGCIAWLGTAKDEHTRYSLHHPLFNIDESALIDGVQVLTNLVIDTSQGGKLCY